MDFGALKNLGSPCIKMEKIHQRDELSSFVSLSPLHGCRMSVSSVIRERI